MRRKRLLIGFLVVAVLLAISTSAYLYKAGKQETQELSFVDFMKLADEGKIKIVYLNDNSLIQGELVDGTKFFTENPRSENFKQTLLLLGIKVEEGQRGDVFASVFRGLLLVGLLVSFIWLISRIMNKGNAPSYKDPVDKLTTMQCETIDDVGVTFDDVAGNIEAKESVADIVDFLKRPEKFARMGARMPRGIIFYGPPGTGKTLLAKAVAGEAGVPYYAFSGSDFVQVYVGVGAARIRDVFRKAREKGKCVIFFDEIDALGKKRDGFNGGSEERSQTLNALLTEMSGFNANEGIVVIAATNRLDVLDEALLRPGRFDRQVEIGLPDVNERKEILRIHCRNKPLSENVSIEKLAQQTVYFSGAQLESLLNEGAILAAKRGARFIENEDIDRAFYTVIAGAEKKDRSAISKVDREVTAYHEAGHALVTKLVAPENRVTKVTIIPSTRGAGGFSVSLPPDRMYRRKKEMENSIKIALGGRAAEEIIFGKDNITTGASNDIEKVTQIASALVKRFGMGDKTGMLNYDMLHSNRGDHNGEILSECKALVERFYKETTELLIENKYLLDRIAKVLLAKETIDEECLERIMKGEADIHPGSLEQEVEATTAKSAVIA
ncbi:MAG: Cell division protein FtsH [Firmicutes bacterium]|nr:Cell division protein FtsH [Bacillota bacterium]MDI6705800.1 AAA family ATPase [Bacillota bacterium]